MAFSPIDHLALAMSSINAAWLSVAVSASVLLTAVAYGVSAPDTMGLGICLALACTAGALAMLGWKVSRGAENSKDAFSQMHARTYAYKFTAHQVCIARHTQQLTFLGRYRVG